jgi:hypothetical protein
MVLKRKPKLTKPARLAMVTTFQQLSLALYNLATHYGILGQDKRRGYIMEHVKGLRQIWQDGHLNGDHVAVIDLDRRMREYRCREGLTDWSLHTEASSVDQQLLHHAIMGTRSRSAAGVSGRPGNVPPAANPPGNPPPKPTPIKTPKPTKVPGGGPAAVTPRVAFNRKCQAANPDVCSTFAWAGTCHRSTGDTCQMGSKVLLHTCATCRFKKATHAIKDGICP